MPAEDFLFVTEVTPTLIVGKQLFGKATLKELRAFAAGLEALSAESGTRVDAILGTALTLPDDESARQSLSLLVGAKAASGRPDRPAPLAWSDIAEARARAASFDASLWSRVTALLPRELRRNVAVADEGLWLAAPGVLGGAAFAYGVLCPAPGADPRKVVPGLALTTGTVARQRPQETSVYGALLARGRHDGQMPRRLELTEADLAHHREAMGALGADAALYLVAYYD